MAGSNTDLTIRIRGRLDGAIRDLGRLEKGLSGVARGVGRAERGWNREARSIRDFARAGAAGNLVSAAIKRGLAGIAGLVGGVVEAGLSMERLERPRGRGVLRRARCGERTCYASRTSTSCSRLGYDNCGAEAEYKKAQNDRSKREQKLRKERGKFLKFREKFVDAKRRAFYRRKHPQQQTHASGKLRFVRRVPRLSLGGQVTLPMLLSCLIRIVVFVHEFRIRTTEFQA